MNRHCGEVLVRPTAQRRAQTSAGWSWDGESIRVCDCKKNGESIHVCDCTEQGTIPFWGRLLEVKLQRPKEEGEEEEEVKTGSEGERMEEKPSVVQE